MIAVVLLLILSLAFSLEVKKECFEVIEEVLYCNSAITEKSLVPQVCGRCELEFKDEKLYIKPAKGCPRYDVLTCQLRSGEFFLINNVSCKPISEEKRSSSKEDNKKRIYRVKITGDFCFSLLRREFEVLKEEKEEALIKATPEELKNLPHCVYSIREE